MGRSQACPVVLLIRLLVQIATATSDHVHNYLQVSFQPTAVRNLTEGHNQTVRIDVTVGPQFNSSLIKGLYLDVK